MKIIDAFVIATTQWRGHWLDSKQLLATRSWFIGIAETRTSRVLSEKSKHVLRVLPSEFETRTYYMLDKSNSIYDVYNTTFVRNFWNLDNFACKINNSTFILYATHDKKFKILIKKSWKRWVRREYVLSRKTLITRCYSRYTRNSDE